MLCSYNVYQPTGRLELKTHRTNERKIFAYFAQYYFENVYSRMDFKKIAHYRALIVFIWLSCFLV